MEPTRTEATEERTNEPAREETTDNSGESSATSSHSNILAQQYTANEGGVRTDMYCPACLEEIFGSYLPIFE